MMPYIFLAVCIFGAGLVIGIVIGMTVKDSRK